LTRLIRDTVVLASTDGRAALGSLVSLISGTLWWGRLVANVAATVDR
jgi:hypothetical protein